MYLIYRQLAGTQHKDSRWYLYKVDEPHISEYEAHKHAAMLNMMDKMYLGSLSKVQVRKIIK